MISAVTKRIVTSVTTPAVTVSCVLHQVAIGCTNAGTTWTLAIQDKATPNPFIWIGPFTLTVPTDGHPFVEHFEFPIPMNGGIDIVTAGTHGEVAVCLIIEA